MTNGSQVIRKVKYKLSNYCSVFQAELFAILNAVKYINKKFIAGDRITICTDSQSSLNALEDPNSVTYLVQEIYSEVRAAEENNIYLQFAWVRAHTGNAGNDLADSLAKAAAVSHQSIAYDLMPVSYVKKAVYQQNLHIWNDRWTTTTNGETTRKFFPTVYQRMQSKRYFTTDFYFTQILSNHGKLNSYLSRFKVTDNEMCSLCKIKEDVMHVIFHCNKYDPQREDLIQHVLQNDISWPCNLEILISQKIFEKFKKFCDMIITEP